MPTSPLVCIHCSQHNLHLSKQSVILHIYYITAIFMPVNKQVLPAHMGPGYLMHIQRLPEDESFRWKLGKEILISLVYNL